MKGHDKLEFNGSPQRDFSSWGKAQSMASISQNSLQDSTGAGNVDSGSSHLYTEVGWFVLGLDKQSIGPYTSIELREHYFNGYLSYQTLVWFKGAVNRQPLAEVPGLFSGAVTQGVTNRKTVVVVSNDKDEFEKWQREVREAEAEAEAQRAIDEAENSSTPWCC